MFWSCPSCPDGAIQDWRPESIIIVAGNCQICKKYSDKHLGCNKCQKPHCIPCILDYDLKIKEEHMTKWYGPKGADGIRRKE